MQDAHAAPDPAPKRALPAQWLAVLYLVFCLLPLGLALTRTAAPAHPWESVAAGLGLMGLGAMAVQFITSGRFRVVSSGLGIDRIMAFHKLAAWWVVVALVLHPLVYILPSWQADPGLGQERLWAYLTLPHYRSGVVALAALVLLFLSSALRARLPLPYELWRATHILLAMVALFGGLHHAITAGRFSAAGAVAMHWWVTGAAVGVILGLLYGWRWWRLLRRPFVLAAIHKQADRIWELDIQPTARHHDLAYHAGQFVWITTGARRFPLFDHPFSIADSPKRPGLTLMIKESGDFTNTIGTLPVGTRIGLDGPHGDFTLEAHPAQSVLLIAGGVGIAPIMGLLRDLVAHQDPRPIRLAYAVGKPDNFACLAEIEAAKQVLDLQVMRLSETGAPGFDGETGRLDAARQQALLAGLDPAHSVAMICGPGPMVTAVSDGLIGLGMPMDRVIYERFDYSGGASVLDRHARNRFLMLGAGLAAGVAAFAIALL